MAEQTEEKSLLQRIGHWPVAMKDYFQELQLEMRKVTWPSRKQVQATTLVVVATVFGFAAYFFVIDGVFSRMIGKLLKAFAQQ